MREIVEIVSRLAELERRVATMVRHGTVEAVDPEKQRVRLRIGGTDEKPFLGPWVPYAQIAGALKVHTPPSTGQQMTLLSPTGDPRQAIALPMTWSNQNASPSDKGDEHVLTFGDCRIELRGNELVVKVPRILVECEGSTFELTGSGLRMEAPDYQFDN